MILAIVGPTGVGKTKLSILLAKKYNAIIVNCDAMQIYRGMNIGTAKIKDEEKEGIIHLMFDKCNLNNEYSVYNYQKDVRKILESHKSENIILVGGTGHYLKAVMYDYVFNPENNNDYEKYSNEELLKMVNAKGNNDIHLNNRRRLISFLKSDKATKTDKILYDIKIIGLTTDRSKLYDIINNRVIKMFNDGLEEEAKILLEKYSDSRALNTAIGYKELKKYFNGEITKEEAINLIQLNSRHYAKRQYTYFNNQLDVKWFNTDYENFNNTVNEVMNYIDGLL